MWSLKSKHSKIIHFRKRMVSSDDDTRTELQFGVESPKMHKTANALAAYKASEEQNKVQL